MSTEYLAVAPNEPFQPVRLYFNIRKKAVYDAFKQLSSISYHESLKRFLWHPTLGMATTYDLDTSAYASGQSPVMASLIFQGEKGLLVIASSYQRALAIQQFLEEKLSGKAARLSGADVATRMYLADESSRDWITQSDPLLGKEITEGSLDDVLLELDSWQDQKEDAPGNKEKANALPEFVHWKLNPRPQTLRNFRMVLSMVRVMAAEHLTGNTGFSLADAAETMYQAYITQEGNTEN